MNSVPQSRQAYTSCSTCPNKNDAPQHLTWGSAARVQAHPPTILPFQSSRCSFWRLDLQRNLCFQKLHFISTIKPYQLGVRRKYHYCFLTSSIFNEAHVAQRGLQELIHGLHGADEGMQGMKSEAQNHEDITESRSRPSRLGSAGRLPF